ncbi:MAG: hypothetical protein GEU78_17305 [Actinobacteria bacterium]|nr:hypothetical protein [Actinomycetota bacterium]
MSEPSHEHRHSGIGLHTPADVHHGRAHAIREARGRVLDTAYLANPERFVRKAPEPPKLPGVVWINKPDDKEGPDSVVCSRTCLRKVDRFRNDC